MSIAPPNTVASADPLKTHVVNAASGELLSVNVFSRDGVRVHTFLTEELAVALDHFRAKRQIENYKDGLGNLIATIAAKWAANLPWIRSVFVLSGTGSRLDAAITLLISVDDSNAQNSWTCSDFALLVGGHSGHAVETCVIEDDIEPQAGYIYSYIRAHAKS